MATAAESVGGLGEVRDGKLPQPAPALPGHHTPSNPRAAAGERYPAPPSKAGHPIATSMLFEDQEIRIWENRQLTGLLGPKHSHEHDYWLVTARCDESPGRMKVKTEKGSWKEMEAPPSRLGSVVYVKHGSVEVADIPSSSPTTVKYNVELKEEAWDGLERKLIHGQPQGWGACAGVIYENTEMRIWDLRVPPGQQGSVPLGIGGPIEGVLHVDVRGQRKGGQILGDLRGSKGPKNTEFGIPPDKKLIPAAGWKGSGVYSRDPRVEGGQTAQAGTAINETAIEYRGVVFEVKAVPLAITARL